MARLCGPSVWLSASPTRTRQGSLVSGFSPSLGAQKAILKKKTKTKKTVSASAVLAPTPPGHLAPLHQFAIVSYRDSEEPRGNDRESASGSRRVWGKPERWVGWISFVRFRAWGLKMSPLPSTLGGKSTEPGYSQPKWAFWKRLRKKGRERGENRFSGWREQLSTLKVEAARASKSRSLPVPAPGASSQAVQGPEVSPAGKGALIWMSIGSLRRECEGLRTE